MADNTNTGFPAGGLGSAAIKVDPQKLKATSTGIAGGISSVRAKLSNIENSVSATSAYWIGDAGDVYRKVYGTSKEEVEVMLRRLSEHVTDLEMMAGVYEESEREALEIAATLPDNVVF